jgi:hypothetical protein
METPDEAARLHRQQEHFARLRPNSDAIEKRAAAQRPQAIETAGEVFVN